LIDAIIALKKRGRPLVRIRMYTGVVTLNLDNPTGKIFHAVKIEFIFRVFKTKLISEHLENVIPVPVYEGDAITV